VQEDRSAVEYDGPSLSEQFPVGERMLVRHHLSGRVLTSGWVVGYTAGLVDLGGPESGPGPVEECDLIVVRCDDGKTRSVYPGNVEPEVLA
jgi:hypothetical protein